MAKSIIHESNGKRCAKCGKLRSTLRSLQRHIKKEHMAAKPKE